MITAYYRPQTLDEALNLLSRSDERMAPAGGGTALYSLGPEPVGVVDLQALNLNHVERRGNQIVLGATLTLQAMSELEDLPSALHTAIQRETSHNLRQAGSVAGTLVACDGRSPFAAAMLALDAHLTVVSASDQAGESIAFGELLPLRNTKLEKRLITQVTIPGHVSLELEMVARTPADWPVVGVAAARWPSGRTRVTLMGFGKLPRLAMDGPEPGGAGEAVQFACSMAADEWASAEYRTATATILVERIMQRLSS